MNGARSESSVREADKALDQAERDFEAALKAGYPLGTRVRVCHARGEFYGEVVGHHLLGKTLRILNENSGKVSKQWYRQVERVQK